VAKRYVYKDIRMPNGQERGMDAKLSDARTCGFSNGNLVHGLTKFNACMRTRGRGARSRRGEYSQFRAGSSGFDEVAQQSRAARRLLDGHSRLLEQRSGMHGRSGAHDRALWL
jgi:hypothetical protein